MQTWLSGQISFDPAICHGKPVVRGTRVLVANVVGAVAAGQSFQDILLDYPSIKDLDIRACLEFAGHLTAMESTRGDGDYPAPPEPRRTVAPIIRCVGGAG